MNSYRRGCRVFDCHHQVHHHHRHLNVVDKTDVLGSGSTSASVKGSAVSALEPDGSLRFFWLDYLEYEGKLYFIGKTQDKSSQAWVSCCVTVENMQRNLFVLPRTRRMEQDEESGEFHETDTVPDPTDVYNDFDLIRKRFGVKSWKAKFVKRNYAFGEKNVPTGESQWMKVVYGFNGMAKFRAMSMTTHQLYPEPQIPSHAESPNFSRVFGTNTSAFELLVLKRRIMGPCWLGIKSPIVDNKGVRKAIPSRSTGADCFSGFLV